MEERAMNSLSTQESSRHLCLRSQFFGKNDLPPLHWLGDPVEGGSLMMNSESSQYDSDRQTLLSRLLDATKECQLRFGGKGELATENDSRVSVLCTAWENCLKYGLKPSNRALAALKQMSEFTGLSRLKSGIFGEINEIETEPVFWHAIRETLSKRDMERYLLLKHVTNDTGRGRAWLRSCLNEKSLARQINGLKSNTKLVSQFYEEWALIRDQQRFPLLADMASGLASVLFAMTIDCEDINKVATSASSHSVSGAAKSATNINTSSFAKLLPNSILSSFQRPGDTRPLTLAGSSEAMVAPEFKQQTRNKKVAKIVSFNDEDDSDDESRNHEQLETVSNEGSKSAVESLRRSDSRTSIVSGNSVTLSDEEYAAGITGLTPLALSGSPVNLYDDDIRSLDSDVPSISCSWNEDSVNALSLAAKTRSASFIRTQGDGSSLPEENTQSAETMSTTELKQAIVMMMLKKDEIEENNKLLKSMLEQEEQYTRGLKEELSELTRKYEEQTLRDQTKVQSVTKDNELLKHQLKNYISAVQKLRSDGPNAENLGIHLDAPQPTITPSQLEETSNQEATEYRRKLIQVAEMHGELMEFNEHLQRQLLQKEGSINRLTTELIELRGPLPTDINSALQDSYGVTDNSEWRPLVNIWMPSVFLKGSSNSSHHVYQVFLRIKDDEWNVYRRYSELHSFYLILKKKYPLVSTFDFPPKKSRGNKEKQFVEDRRKRLQIFLRKTVQHVVSSEHELSANGLCRAKLVSMFPLLGDIALVGVKKKVKIKNGRAGASPLNNSPSQQYTGYEGADYSHYHSSPAYEVNRRPSGDN